MDVIENNRVELEDGGVEIEDGKRKPREKAQRIVLSLIKKSYIVRTRSTRVYIRKENCHRLWCLVIKLVRQHNWKEASGMLSVLLKGTLTDKSPAKNRTKYWVAMELLKRIDGESINLTKFKHVYDIWMRKISSMKLKHKDRYLVQLEFIIFCLTHGNLEEAHQAAICLMQEREFRMDSLSSMVIGLTYCQLWYSSIPKEMRVNILEERQSPMQSEISRRRFSESFYESDGHNAADIDDANYLLHCNSETSIMNGKKRSVDVYADENQRREKSRNPNLQGFYMNPGENSDSEEASVSTDTEHEPVFYRHELDSLLLPIRLATPNEDLKDINHLQSGMLNDNYKAALKYLRGALRSSPDSPPLLAALLPLMQLLLVRGKVKEALRELKQVCQISNATLPFRLRANLLESIDGNNCFMLSTSFEDVIKKDPSDRESLERLIRMHQNGDYGVEALLEMIALHLDATYAEYSIWREFGLCFLQLSQCEEDRMSGCHNGDNGRGFSHEQSCCLNKSPKRFIEGILGESWRFRCKWWLTRHFSENILNSEIQAGDFQLLTYKAACASHMYGQEFNYVLEVHNFLEDEKDGQLFSFLELHMQHSSPIFPIPYRPSTAKCAFQKKQCDT